MKGVFYHTVCRGPFSPPHGQPGDERVFLDIIDHPVRMTVHPSSRALHFHPPRRQPAQGRGRTWGRRPKGHGGRPPGLVET
jgi:hypothetical protein